MIIIYKTSLPTFRDIITHHTFAPSKNLSGYFISI